ncbi:MAG: sodium:proton antiporter NhaD [Rikenellaceae bacterium]|nr:sodium:proton antiporter NhaD [Rikenellaceae bacterium]
MTALMLCIFVLGYLGIALEHNLNVNKAGIALVTGVLLWVVYIAASPGIIPVFSPDEFDTYISVNNLGGLSLREQYISFVSNFQLLEQIGDIAEILLLLMGAMTIVELIDVHGGFDFITSRIKSRNKHKLLWIVAFLAFFMSALLDNLTTSIVMVMLLRKIIANYKERWLFGSIIIIAANSGGAWSPIGDVTTIMLWIKGNITSLPTIVYLILPCLVSLIIPAIIASRLLHGILTSPDYKDEVPEIFDVIGVKGRLSILIGGILCLLSIPVFKSVTHLSPFMGGLLALGVLWIYTEVMYSSIKNIEESIKFRVVKVIKHIDMGTILFFLGILLSVGALQCAGILSRFGVFLDDNLHNPYMITTITGILSSIVDNVPLVAAATGMYPVADPAMAAVAADLEYLSMFVQDGMFWQLLTYCAGTGGSILIIGSAAGVVVMGLEKINFMWYAKNISLMALTGFLSGVLVYYLQTLIFF